VDQAEMEALLFAINCTYPSATRLSPAEHAVRVNEWMTSPVVELDYPVALAAWDQWKAHQGWPPSPAQLLEQVAASTAQRLPTYQEATALEVASYGDPVDPEDGRRIIDGIRESIRRERS